jgi:hypothetical protein
LRIAVRQVEARNQHAFGGSFDVSALPVFGRTGQAIARQLRPDVACQDGNTVPGVLALPDGLVAGALDIVVRKLAVCAFELLQAHDIGLGLLEPFQEERQSAIDVVDVEARDLHRSSRATPAANIGPPLWAGNP